MPAKTTLRPRRVDSVCLGIDSRTGLLRASTRPGARFLPDKPARMQMRISMRGKRRKIPGRGFMTMSALLECDVRKRVLAAGTRNRMYC